MCGRLVRYTPVPELARRSGAASFVGNPPASYNITPGQDIVNLRELIGERVIEALAWGLVPRWVKGPQKAYPTMARAETVATDALFRQAFHTGRSIVPVDGYFIWRRCELGWQPYYVHRRDGEPLWLAGVSDLWEGGSRWIVSCAIITTEANGSLAAVSERMPAVLDEADWPHWLDTDYRDFDALLGMLRPCAPARLDIEAVSPRVNSPRNDDPTLLKPVA